MIIHVDMDAFYASVEMRENPQLQGLPVVVGGKAGRGVVAAANYIAREYGIHSAMPVSRALRLCPQVVCVAPNFALYGAVSAQVHEILQRYTPHIEPLSLDEAFLDVRNSVRLFGSEIEIAAAIKQQVADELNLVVSVGVAPNKFTAKIASDIAKPNGFVVVAQSEIQNFLDPLPVGRVWGVGKVMQQKLQVLGVTTIGQLRCMQLTQLRKHFSSHGEHLYRLARGIDTRAVVCDAQVKSISNETTFELDLQDMHFVRGHLLALTEQVARRLRAQELFGKTISIKIRYTDFTTLTRAHTLPMPTQSTKQIWSVVERLFETNVKTVNKPLRLVGVGISGLDNQRAQQTTLFADESDKQDKIDQMSDIITRRFGTHALRRGAAKSVK